MVNYPRKMENAESAPQVPWPSETHGKVLSFTDISQLFPKNIKASITSGLGSSQRGASKKYNLSKMKVAEIRSELAAAGLETWGTRPVLMSRFREHLEALKGGTVTPEAVKEKAKKDMDARRQGLEPAADFKVHMGEEHGSILLSDHDTSPWGSRGQETVVNVADISEPIGRLVSGEGQSSLKLRDIAREELKMYLELLPMCSRIGVHASPIDFSVMLQVSCGLADVRSTVDILLHFRAFEVDEPWVFRRIMSPIRFLLEHCFNPHERTTAATDGLLVLETMNKVGLKPDEQMTSLADSHAAAV